MAVDVSSEIVIRRPMETVAAYAADPDRAPEWYVNIRSVDWATEPPLRVGSRVAFVAHFLGRTLRYTYEITHYEPAHRLVMRTSEGPFPMETIYSWSPEGESATRMTLRNRGRPAGFARILAPFLALAMQRANRHDLQRLRRLLETGGA
jgi:uncharacterized membrane protein